MFTKHLLPARHCAKGLQAWLITTAITIATLQMRKPVGKRGNLLKITQLMLVCKWGKWTVPLIPTPRHAGTVSNDPGVWIDPWETEAPNNAVPRTRLRLQDSILLKSSLPAPREAQNILGLLALFREIIALAHHSLSSACQEELNMQMSTFTDTHPRSLPGLGGSHSTEHMPNSLLSSCGHPLARSPSLTGHPSGGPRAPGKSSLTPAMSLGRTGLRESGPRVTSNASKAKAGRPGCEKLSWGWLGQPMEEGRGCIGLPRGWR